MNNISDVLRQSIESTINKYYRKSEEQNFRETYYNFTKTALTKIFSEDNYKCFTSDNNSRNNVIAIGKDALLAELIKGAYTTYAIETVYGYARELSTGNSHPINESQAVNYVFKQLEAHTSPSVIYSTIARDEHLRELLISNYALLVANYTREQELNACSRYEPLMQREVNTLNNLQLAVMNNPNGIQSTYVNMSR